MRLLLDTHTALWLFAGSPQISPALEQDLTDPANELFFSDISAWEIVIKHSLGKLALPSLPEMFVSSLVTQHGDINHVQAIGSAGYVSIVTSDSQGLRIADAVHAACSPRIGSVGDVDDLPAMTGE